MTLKQFLKPDWRKIVIFVVLFIFSSFFLPVPSAISQNYMGLPFSYLKGYYGEYSEFDVVSLLLDLIFYYLLSCLIVWIYDKFRKGK